MGNSQFTVQGEVRLDTAQVTAGTAEVRTALQDLVKSSQVAGASIDQIVTEFGQLGRAGKIAGASLDQVVAEIERLPAANVAEAQTSKQVTTEFNNMSRAATSAAGAINTTQAAMQRSTAQSLQMQGATAAQAQQVYKQLGISSAAAAKEIGAAFGTAATEVQALGGSGKEAGEKVATGIRGVFPALSDLRQITRLAMGAFALGFIIAEFGQLVEAVQSAADSIGGFDKGLKEVISDAERLNESLLVNFKNLTVPQLQFLATIKDAKKEREAQLQMEIANGERSLATLSKQNHAQAEQLELVRQFNATQADQARGIDAAAEQLKIFNKAQSLGIDLNIDLAESQKKHNKSLEDEATVARGVAEARLALNKAVNAENLKGENAARRDAAKALREQAQAIKELDALATRARAATVGEQGVPELVALQKQQDAMAKIADLDSKLPAVHRHAADAKLAIDEQYYGELAKLAQASDRDTSEFLAAEALKRQELNGKTEDIILQQGEAAKQKLIEQGQAYFLAWSDLMARMVQGDASAWAKITALGESYFQFFKNLSDKLASVDETTNARIVQQHKELAAQLMEHSDQLAQQSAGSLIEITKRANDQQLQAERAMQESRRGLVFSTSAAVEKIRMDEAAQILKINLDARDAADEIALDQLQANQDALRKGLEANVDFSDKETEVWARAAQARTAVERAAQAEIAREQQRAVEQMADKIDQFIDRVFLTARSLKDVLNQLWTQILGSFVKMVSHMIAEWALGTKQMQATSTSSSGGLLGALFGGLFGGGGAIPQGGTAGEGGVAGMLNSLGISSNLVSAPGGVVSGIPGAQSVASLVASGAISAESVGLSGPSAFSNVSGASLAVPALSLGAIAAQQGAFPEATGGVVSPKIIGGAAQGPLGKLAFGQFSKPGKTPTTQALGGLADQALLAGGIALGISAIGSNTPLSGALRGAASGAAIGFEFGGPLGALIGASIGLDVGFIAGLIGRGKAKRHAASLEDQFHFAADQVVEEYKLHKADYESSIQALQTLDQQFDQSELRYGKWGRNAIAHIDSMTRERVKIINDLEAERQRRGEIIAGLPVPEFSRGGVATVAVGAIHEPARPAGGLPLPDRFAAMREYAAGGLGGMNFARPDGHMLAWIRPDEYVIRPEATRALGKDFLDRVNRAPGFEGGGIASFPHIDPVIHSSEFKIMNYELPVLALGGTPSFAPVSGLFSDQSGEDFLSAPIAMTTPAERSGPSRSVAVNVTFSALDGPSMQAWWRAHQADVVRTVRRAVRDGG